VLEKTKEELKMEILLSCCKLIGFLVTVVSIIYVITLEYNK
jgi:hypothetical protein